MIDDFWVIPKETVSKIVYPTEIGAYLVPICDNKKLDIDLDYPIEIGVGNVKNLQNTKWWTKGKQIGDSNKLYELKVGYDLHVFKGVYQKLHRIVTTDFKNDIMGQWDLWYGTHIFMVLDMVRELNNENQDLATKVKQLQKQLLAITKK